MHTQPRSSLQDDSSLGMCDRGLLRTCTTEIKKIDVCTCIDNLNDLNQTFRYALSEPFQQPFQGRNVTPPAPVWERSVNIVRDWVHTLVATQGLYTSVAGIAFAHRSWCSFAGQEPSLPNTL